jgi:hypothetical protein
VKNKFAVAMTLFALLAALSWLLLSDPKLRLVTLALLALFAVKTWIHHRKQLLEERDEVAAQERFQEVRSRS